MGFKFHYKENKLEEHVNYAPGKRRVSKIQWYLLVLIIASPILYFIFKMAFDIFIVTGSGNVVFDEQTIRASENSYIKKVFVKVSTDVVDGQPLVDLYAPDLGKELDYLTKELETLRTQKKDLELHNPELAPLSKMKGDALINFTETKKDYDSLINLRNRGLATIADMAQVRRNYSDAQILIKEIDRKISENQAKYQLAAENQYGQKIREIQNKIEKANITIASLHVKATEKGSLTKVFVNEGEFVLKGQELMKIATSDTLHIKAYLPSRFVHKKIRLGDNITILFPDNIKIKGTITDIPDIAEGEPSVSNIVRKEKNKIVLLIAPVGEIPEKYKVMGLPVDIYL